MGGSMYWASVNPCTSSVSRCCYYLHCPEEETESGNGREFAKVLFSLLL